MDYTDLTTALRSVSWASLQDCDEGTLAGFRDALWHALAQLPAEDAGERLLDDGFEYRAKYEGSTVWEAGVYSDGAPLLVLEMPNKNELLLLNLLCSVPALLRGARAILAWDAADTLDDAVVDEYIALVTRFKQLVPQIEAQIAFRAASI